MQLAPEQEEAARKVNRWLKDPDQQVFHLFGYAGTGKTTLAKHLAKDVSGQVIFAAFTGKAAHVLRSKGCDGAQTIHSLIYHTRDKSRNHLIKLEDALRTQIQKLKDSGLNDDQVEMHSLVIRLKKDIKDESDNAEQPMFVLNPESKAISAALIVIDECSMVDARMATDLLSFGTKVLVLGDPAQLPPVGGAGYFTEGVDPDVMLTDIHRQAGESPIIRMATDVRNKRPLSLGDWGDGCMVLPTGSKLDPDDVLSFDQVLVGKNKTRKSFNKRIRNLKGISDPFPVIDDRLVCLRNNTELGLLNGAIFEVSDVTGVMDNKVHMSIRPEGELSSLDVSAHEHHFLGTEEHLGWYEKKEAEEFAFGYALTCHKAQGSQWRSVGVFDESFCFRKDRHRWLYTAITRAADHVVVINM